MSCKSLKTEGRLGKELSIVACRQSRQGNDLFQCQLSITQAFVALLEGLSIIFEVERFG